MNNKEREQADGAACGVNQHVGHPRRARGHENLVKFVGGGVEKDQEQGAADLGPGPRRQPALPGVQRAPEQERQHGVFGQMRAFADEMVDLLDVRLRHVREEPVQEGFNEQRGVFIGLRVAGTGENDSHPHERRQPEFQKETQPGHAE